MTRVKICGITREEDANVAIEAGADALGFVLYPPSPRAVDPEKIVSWMRLLPPLVTRVAVVVRPSPAQLETWRQLQIFDAWQFHGGESSDTIKAFSAERKIRAMALPGEGADVQWREAGVSALLLDAAGPGVGGTGLTIDWQAASDFRQRCTLPILLAGGLSPSNIAEAIAIVRPFGVDASSGLESAPGRKDHAKVRQFVQAAHGAG